MTLETDKVKNQSGSRSGLLMFLLGLLLLLPALKVGFDMRLLPALQTIQLSTQEYNLVRSPAQFVGSANYSELFTDARFSGALQFGISLLLTRLFILAIVPPVVGLLAGAGNLLARSLNRVVLSVIAGLAIPLALALLWRIYWSPMWGMEPSPIFDQNHSLASIDGARDLVMLLDALIMLGTGGVAGIIAFMAVMRGRNISRSVSRTAVAVWLLVILFGYLTITGTFLVPYVLTNGGPGTSTLTPQLYNYMSSFQRFQVGYAAAGQTLFILAVLPAIFLAWLILELSRMRLTSVPARGGSFVGVVALPLLLLMAYPLISLALWGHNLAANNQGYDQFFEQVSNASAYSAIAAPWQAIWLIQLPVTLLAGFALGFLRPGGRVVSALLFLLLMLMVAIPDETLHTAWFIRAHDLGILNTPSALMIPWQISILPLLVFKLFFEGAREKYQQAVQEGAQPQSALFSRVILPVLPVVLVVGAVLCFQSAQDFQWSLIVLNSKDLMPLPLQAMQFTMQMMQYNAGSAAAASHLIGQIAVVFIPVFAVLSLLVVDRLALITGRSSTLKNEAASETPAA